jgi:predicted PurR-regulated permease PerM
MNDKITAPPPPRGLFSDNDASAERQSSAPRPNIHQVSRVLQPVDIRSLTLSGIFILLVLSALKIGSSFFVPVVLAFLLNFMFAPLVRSLSQLRLPQPLGAALVFCALIGSLTYGIHKLAAPASGWMSRLPASIRQIEDKLQRIKLPVQEISKASQEVDRITSLDLGQKTQKVEVKKSSVGAILLDQTQDFVVGAVVMLLLLFFLLASGDLFLRKLVNLLPRLRDKKCAVEISRQIEHDVSSYLFAVTALNIVFGTAVGLAMFLLGMPNPALWGVTAGFLHFIPFLGAIVGIGTVTSVALLTLDHTTTILLVPSVYFALNLLEEYLLLPFVISRRFMLNPVIIFLWLIFWGWLWGIPGALMAVPLLAILKIICDRVEPLSAIGKLVAR